MTPSHPSPRSAYVAGLVLCLLAALASQPLLPPGGTGHPLAQAFTGLTFLVAAVLVWRLPRRLTAPAPAATWALVCAACLLPLALGWLLALDGGLLRHARTFTLMPPLMFLALAPRPPRQAPLSAAAHD